LIPGVFSTAASFTSTVLAFIVALWTYRAYRVTGKRYLLNFMAGFLMLGVSFYLLRQGLPPFGSFAVYPEFQWPYLAARTGGYALIASAYYARKRHGETAILSIVILVVIAAISFLISSPPVPGTYVNVDGYLSAANAILALYIFGKAAQGYVQLPRMRNALVVSGFGALALSQYSWVLWAFDGGTLAFAMAQLVRVVGLILLALAALGVWRRPH
jgi:hypothetical protein